MWKNVLLSWALILPAMAQARGELTVLEEQWLRLAWPVLIYARQQGLPLDVVVQPQPTPGEAPLAMAYIDDRCKLVLSMRGNPAAETALSALSAALLQPAVEAMAAHELGHCWRYLRGAWHTVPAGFSAPAGEIDDTRLREQWQAMQQTRREEAYADLVGLAWTLRQHPQHYAAVYAWLVSFRDDGSHSGHHHDTLAWLKLAADPRAFTPSGALPADTPFDAAWPVWQAGLLAAP